MQSLATLVTIKNINDIKLLLSSLEILEFKLPIYILCDQMSTKYLSDYNLNIKIYANLSNIQQTRQQMEKNGTWIDFMLKKCDIIDIALHDYDNTLFVDSDLVFFKLPHLDFSKSNVLLSPHYIRDRDEKQYGRYNGGYIGVGDKSFTSWWRSATKTMSTYMEQECLIHAHDFFTIEEIPIQHNYGWWRLFQNEEVELRKSKFTVSDVIYYDNLPLVSIHTHFKTSEHYEMYAEYNNFICELLKRGNDTQKILQKIQAL